MKVDASLDESIIWYIAGPMSWVPQFNFPLFDEVRDALCIAGHLCVSPADLDGAEIRELALDSDDGDPKHLFESTDTDWAEVMGRDIETVIGDCGGVVLLPKWYYSRGASLEAYAALVCGHKFALAGLDSLIASISEAYVGSQLGIPNLGFLPGRNRE